MCFINVRDYWPPYDMNESRNTFDWRKEKNKNMGEVARRFICWRCIAFMISLCSCLSFLVHVYVCAYVIICVYSHICLYTCNCLMFVCQKGWTIYWILIGIRNTNIKYRKLAFPVLVLMNSKLTYINKHVIWLTCEFQQKFRWLLKFDRH